MQAERNAAAAVNAALAAEHRTALDALLVIHPGTTVSSLVWARQSPGAPGHRSLARMIEQIRHLRKIGIPTGAADGVHAERVGRFVREGSRLTAQHLRALAPARRRAILAVTVNDTITRLTDETIGLFDRLIGRLFRRAERRAAVEHHNNARAINDKLRLLAKIGDALLRRVGPLFLDAFEFQGVGAVSGLLRALTAIRAFYGGPRRVWPKDMPTAFIRRGWRAAVLRDGAIDGPAYELCLFAELRDRLRAGDVWVVGSRQYRAVEDQLIPKALFTAMRAAGPLPVVAPLEAERYLQDRRAAPDARLRDIDLKAGDDRLTDVRLNGGVLKITPHDAATPEEADRLADRIYGLLPRIRITDLLDEVAGWTGAAACFTHLRTGQPADDRRVILTAVLADATNLGLTRMAEACALAIYKQLAWAAGWHISDDAYGRALARIIGVQQSQPLAAFFGRGTASSSDGQHFPLGGRGEVSGAVNPHKGAGPAISFYTHLSDRYAPYHSKVISVAEGEAAHVIDGLLYHGADLKVAVHHVDGGGVSDHVFALCHFLGFRFAPRIPNLHDRRLYAFGPAASWPNLEPFIAGRIDEDLIRAHWDDLLRLATSIRTGTVPASLMLKRLGSYPRQNGLALALREVGRIERSLFTLDWLDDPALRRQATAELNKGESRNALARAVCFHRLGRIRDRTPDSQQHRAGGLNLVVAAIILWNTVYMQRAINALRARGETIDDNLLGFLAPLGWQHINLTGDYLWSAAPEFEADGYRRLRTISEAMAA